MVEGGNNSTILRSNIFKDMHNILYDFHNIVSLDLYSYVATNYVSTSIPNFWTICQDLVLVTIYTQFRIPYLPAAGCRF